MFEKRFEYMVVVHVVVDVAAAAAVSKVDIRLVVGSLMVES